MVEFECYECGGTGWRVKLNRNMRAYKLKCYTCNGEGKLDWVDNIIPNKDHWEIIWNDMSKAVGIPISHLCGGYYDGI
jgi:hypothetical protein